MHTVLSKFGLQLPSSLALAGGRVGAMPKTNVAGTVFDANIKIENKLTISGGISKQFHVLNTMDVGGETFVELKKSENWLCRMVAGYHKNNSPLKRTRFLETLRSTALAALKPVLAGDGSEPTPADEGSDKADDSDDPMAALCPADAPPPKRRRGTKGRGRGRGRGRAPGAAETPVHVEGAIDVNVAIPCDSNGATDTFRVYVRGQLATLKRATPRTLNLWAAIDSVPNVLAALRTEYESHGVPPIADDAADDTGDEAAAALGAGMSLKVWFDFRSRAWVVGQGTGSGKHILQKFPVPQFKRGSKVLLSQDEYKQAMAATKAKADACVADVSPAAVPSGAGTSQETP